MTTVHPEGEPGGLRERKKRRTRDALIRSALELFTTRGYEETTVDDIAEAAGVSQRTFFRYFPGKEAVAFSVHDLVEEHFLDAFGARPDGEPPLTALRRAVSVTWDTFGEAVGETVEPGLHMRMYQVIESTPALLATAMCRSAELEDRLVRDIARRAGTDPVTDLRPRVLVAAFTGVMRMTGRIWGAGPDASAEALRRLTERHLDAIGPALALDGPAPQD
ncbi:MULTISPECIES: TetR family transcriptional regulator [Streptomyces]|uniref:Uncharacterized protein n=1 Tax=Streptomyces fradiae TaxID=1906 RepID=A0ACC4WB35_STRFR|nr:MULTISPECIES: TetR family transcriptional regulator [Streptomyces]KNE81841.1 hypothetical protein ADZ36_14525 [Streptomyces fradiae]